MHARRRIVLAVVAALRPLVDAGTVTAIAAGRAAPQPVAKAPYLLVYARTEQSRSINMDDDRRLQRSPTLAIEAVFASVEDSDEKGDDLALAVEVAMAADSTLGGLIKDIELARTDLDARADGETRLGRVRLEFAVEYHTTAGRPDASLD
ncbi:hypothetical protein [Reyranella sp.]|uniref:hypothetical protein n=1 Tax=Reyranella sp. TaxID=1929291 RepID=UPI003D1110D9